MTLTITGPFAFEAAEDLADEVDGWLRQETNGSFCHRGTLPGRFWGVVDVPTILTPDDLQRLCRTLGKRYQAELS